MISVVLFDLDDTLFAHSRAVETGITAHRRSHGGAFGAADDGVEAARWTHLEEHHYHRYLAGELGYLDQRRERARGFVSPWHIDLSTDEAADAWFGEYLLEYRAAWCLHDDAVRVLDALLPRRFGIITNAELEYQRQKLEGLAISHRFEHVVASGAVGFAKPDARIFAHAASVFAVRPGDCAYIGDRLHADAIGASRAGMRGIWIDRSDAATDVDRREAATAGVTIVNSLDEIPGLLDGA